MTAVGDAQPKVPVSSEPKLSYFSQYHTIVSRSIWDPLSPGVVGGARDLIGRVVIVTTALAGYLVAALISIPFWYSNYLQARSSSEQIIDHLCGPKKPDDIGAKLHTHNQLSIDPAFFLPQEKILQICDIENLQEEEYIYTGDLTVEKKQIQLLMEDSNTQPLIEYICQMAEGKKALESKFVSESASNLIPVRLTMGYALGALFVLLGVKPALVIECRSDKKLFSILTNLAQKHPNLRLKATPGVYFVNETPFPSFDPRYFLNLSSEVSLMEAVETCFPRQSARCADQFLSYLLGFGPSWEAYAINVSYLYREQHPDSCVFSRNHYYEIGKVLNQSLFNKETSRPEIENLGFIFHSQLALLIDQRHWEKRELSVERTEREIAVATMIDTTGTEQVFDGLTLRTEYFKKSYTLKKWVMETYFPQFL